LIFPKNWKKVWKKMVISQGNQPYKGEPYGKEAAQYRRDLSKILAFVPTDAHGFGGQRTKPQDAGPGDM
jgi:hypothetical protein